MDMLNIDRWRKIKNPVFTVKLANNLVEFPPESD
jgi:hypothetical protein